MNIKDECYECGSYETIHLYNILKCRTCGGEYVERNVKTSV